MIHVLETYFNSEEEVAFSDRCTEGFVAEAITALETVIKKPGDLEARGQLSYLGAIALHGFINRPRGGYFPMHAIEHPLSAQYNISHGRGLALIFPRWLRYVSRTKPDKIITFGERVFSMDLETYHPFEGADRAIDRLEEWLSSVGAFYYMDDLGIPNDLEMFRRMAESAIRIYGGNKEVLDGIKPLGVDDIVAIYINAVRLGYPATVAANEEGLSEVTQDQIEEE
jgi:alcohol dehydrogenase YqhD (iron-dependent ADH family)